MAAVKEQTKTQTAQPMQFWLASPPICVACIRQRPHSQARSHTIITPNSQPVGVLDAVAEAQPSSNL